MHSGQSDNRTCPEGLNEITETPAPHLSRGTEWNHTNLSTALVQGDWMKSQKPQHRTCPEGLNEITETSVPHLSRGAEWNHRNLSTTLVQGDWMKSQKPQHRTCPGGLNEITETSAPHLSRGTEWNHRNISPSPSWDLNPRIKKKQKTVIRDQQWLSVSQPGCPLVRRTLSWTRRLQLTLLHATSSTLILVLYCPLYG